MRRNGYMCKINSGYHNFIYNAKKTYPSRNGGKPEDRRRKEYGMNTRDYRSLNFSTTRTLSPRTVIGIGTTLS
ncbi:MAG: hypothetical protein METHP_00972 [Methanoregula sp. SKADARSKE-2]|nr:MAG: hypothetical protein METHP_00972 [Methanoregula sp. SKADARSKE-2]